MGDEKFEIADYRRMAYAAEPDAAPDKGRLACTVRRWNGEIYESRVFERTVAAELAKPTGAAEEERPVTAGGKQESLPLYSPDQSRLAFLSDASGVSRVWIRPEGEDEAPVMTGEKLPEDFSVTRYCWTPDGGRLLVAGYRILEKKDTPAAWKDPHIGEGGSYRSEADGGWKIKKEYAVWGIAIQGETAECIYRTQTKIGGLVLSGDGKRLWLQEGETWAGISPGAAAAPEYISFLYSADGYGLCQPAGAGELLAAGLAKEELAKNGMTGLDPVWIDGDGKPLSLQMDGDVPDEILPSLSPGSPFAEANRRLLYLPGEAAWSVIGAKKGAAAVYLVKKEEDRVIWRRVTDGTGVFGAICAGEEGVLYGIRADTGSPYDLVRIDLRSGAVTGIADHNPWLQKKQKAQAYVLQVPSLDGNTLLCGKILRPRRSPDAPEAAAPVVLLVHGGPSSFYGDDFVMEAQLLAAEGFAVVLADPRGSTGYGKAHARTELAYDGTAYQDLLYFLDRALSAFPWMDGTRMSVAGGSYGGYMTAWMAGHCSRFRTAVVMRGLLNFQFLALTSEAAGQPELYAEPRDFQDWMMRAMKASPASYADRMNLPLLILHGEADVCCPADGAHQLYVGVKDTHPDLPVRMVLFPGAGHNIRAAKLSYYERYERELIGWLKKYGAQEESDS